MEEIMSNIVEGRPGEVRLLQGNDAIARGALEAGVNVVASYPGTPSSEVTENLAAVSAERGLYVEWSVNEKVALEVAAAASFSGLRSLCAMKQVGVNVAADFLLHVGQYGTRGAMVLLSCEDPGALSSTNEGDSRQYARSMEIPMVEPGDLEEARTITRWAFELSEELKTVVMVRSVTRMSHASGNVELGELPPVSQPKAFFNFRGPLLGQMEGPVANEPPTALALRRRNHGKLKRAQEIFETSPFNTYSGPSDPELLVITSSACNLYCLEAIRLLVLTERVGLLKLGTTWPLPAGLIKKHLLSSSRVLIVEDLHPFLEENVKVLAAEFAGEIGAREFHGKRDGSLPMTGEMNADLVMETLVRLLALETGKPFPGYSEEVSRALADQIPPRMMTFCPGCPHRASYWSVHTALAMDDREGFVCGDIGCYALGTMQAGFNVVKTIHAMGSGSGLASGFGQMKTFGLEQPVLAVCGDSTFFHSALPAMANSVHNGSNAILLVMDNRGTAMTGFQPHPGSSVNAGGQAAQGLDIAAVCRGMGASVQVCDPFDLKDVQERLLNLLEGPPGMKVLVLQQACALSPERKGKKNFEVEVDEQLCLGDACGCNRLCTRAFRCPALVWDKEVHKTRVDTVLCAGCGVCASICPKGAIQKREATQNGKA
jgi:indolepyruvate ferredoxin oxidoreductase, alpha subunit